MLEEDFPTVDDLPPDPVELGRSARKSPLLPGKIPHATTELSMVLDLRFVVGECAHAGAAIGDASDYWNW